MATGDFINLASTTHSNPGETYGGGITAPANPTYAYDSNAGTPYGADVYRGGGGDWGYYIYICSQHHFTTPRSITSIPYYIYARTNAYGNYPNGSYYMGVDISYNNGASWTNLYYSSGGCNSGAVSSNTTIAGTWNSVTDIRAYVYAAAGGDRDGYCGAYIYDLRALGTMYTDIGLKLQKNGATYNIGVADLEATHKLRVQHGATTYGIPLLDVSDINASTIRICTDEALGTIKALPIATV